MLAAAARVFTPARRLQLSVICLQALQGSKLNNKPVKIYIHDPLSKERQAELAAANSTKAQKKKQPAAAQVADGSTPAAGGDGSADSSSSKAGRKQRQQQRSRMTYSVKVSNMSWSTTAEGLSQHFADCPVSCRLDQVSRVVLAWV
jgi:RNA recognition motif-containing protein